MSTAATMARRPPATPAPFVSNTQLAMAAVIVGELMMFGGLVGMYLLFRLQAEVWPPAGLPRLPLGVTSLNTLVLIASAWPMHRALAAVRAGRQDAAAGAATWAAALRMTSGSDPKSWIETIASSSCRRSSSVTVRRLP